MYSCADRVGWNRAGTNRVTVGDKQEVAIRQQTTLGEALKFGVFACITHRIDYDSRQIVQLHESISSMIRHKREGKVLDHWCAYVRNTFPFLSQKPRSPS